MKAQLKIAVVVLLAVPISGCVFAARHIAREANRATIQDKGRHRFPVGSSAQAAREKLVSEGYRCLDLPDEAKVRAHISCWPGHRTNFAEKFLIGGNWRWDLYQQDDRLTMLHISSPRRGLRRRHAETPATPAATPPATGATPGS